MTPAETTKEGMCHHQHPLKPAGVVMFSHPMSEPCLLREAALRAELETEHAARERLFSCEFAGWRERAEKAEASLVEMQKHRDTWRGYAYGRRPKPTDFLDGNMVEEDRGPTAIEKAEAELTKLRDVNQNLADAHNDALALLPGRTGSLKQRVAAVLEELAAKGG